MNHLQLPFYVIARDVQVIQVQVQRGPGCQKYKFVEIIKLSTSNGFGEHFVTLAETKISLNSIFFFYLIIETFARLQFYFSFYFSLTYTSIPDHISSTQTHNLEWLTNFFSQLQLSEAVCDPGSPRHSPCPWNDLYSLPSCFTKIPSSQRL